MSGSSSSSDEDEGRMAAFQSIAVSFEDMKRHQDLEAVKVTCLGLLHVHVSSHA